MYRLFLVLMIALLPLRGWVGEAMATDMARAMAAQPLAAGQKAPVAHEQSATTVVHADCAGHHGEAMQASVADPAADCSTCTVCQVCHTVALVTSTPAMAPLPLPATPPAARPTGYASAVPAPGLKPPIS